MRIKILQFEVKEKYVHRPSTWWQRLLGINEVDQYHFDTVMKVDPDYMATARELQVDDFVMLPNAVRLKVWSVDRFGIVKAKTYKMIVEDLRGYLPMEMYLVYPRVHGRIQDKAI
jgi:hypothetical protein